MKFSGGELKSNGAVAEQLTFEVVKDTVTDRRLMTTRELADRLKTSPKVILENARKCLPDKVIENGKQTFWDEAEVTVLIDRLKNNQKTNSSDPYFQSKGSISTELTPALKIKKAMELMQEGYEEELAILRAKNAEKQAVIDRIANGKGCYSMNQTAKALKLPYGNITLFEKLRTMQVLNQDNTPKQEQVNNGNFKVVVKFVNEKVGSRPVTLTTGKGLVYLARKFNTDIDESVAADM